MKYNINKNNIYYLIQYMYNNKMCFNMGFDSFIDAITLYTTHCNNIRPLMATLLLHFVIQLTWELLLYNGNY